MLFSDMVGKGGGKEKQAAFALFAEECRAEHKKLFPDEEVEPAELSKKCAERWKTMTEREKQWFTMMAECKRSSKPGEASTAMKQQTKNKIPFKSKKAM